VHLSLVCLVSSHHGKIVESVNVVAPTRQILILWVAGWSWEMITGWRERPADLMWAPNHRQVEGVDDDDLRWVRALPVPMHLSLIDRPFVPHNLISSQESPVSLPKFQVAPRLKILKSSGSKKKPRYTILLSLKSPNKQIPSRFPTGSLWREIPAYSEFLHISWYIYIFISKVLWKECPSMFPKSVVPMETDAHFRALFNISLRFDVHVTMHRRYYVR
jgi:hypothetical protein